MKIGKIILLALGAVFIALGIKSIVDIPGQEKILETAVYLDEPRVLSENEGKLVIIHGKPEMTAPAFDHELKLTLDTIKAYRYREIYKRTEDTDEKIKWEWVADGQTTFVGKARIGDFDLDESILSAFPTESHYKDLIRKKPNTTICFMKTSDPATCMFCRTAAIMWMIPRWIRMITLSQHPACTKGHGTMKAQPLTVIAIMTPRKTANTRLSASSAAAAL